MKNKTKLKTAAAAVIAALVSACTAAGVGTDPQAPPKDVDVQLTLDSLTVTYKDEAMPLLAYEKGKSYYLVNTIEGKEFLSLSYTVPENVEVKISPDKIPSYAANASITHSADPDNDVIIDAEKLGELPVPRLDPDFLVADFPAGVDAYEIKLELTLKDDAAAVSTEGNMIYHWQPNSYTISITEPAANLDSEENKQKIHDKLEEAQAKIQNLGMAVGNPDENDPSVGNITLLMSELKTLQDGTLETREYETQTPKDTDVIISQRTGATADEIIYTVRESFPVYDNYAIFVKARQLCAALDNTNVDYVIVPEIRLDYISPTTAKPEPVQPVLIGSKGDYQIELVAGNGGHVWTGKKTTTTGGYGGKVNATFGFNKDEKLGFRIGGEGIGTADLAIVSRADLSADQKTEALWAQWQNAPGEGNDHSYVWAAEKAGGWNGGGKGGKNGGNTPSNRYAWAAGSGGGGASDVRLYSGGGSSLSSSFTYSDSDPRIMVAGGGGGAGQRSGGTGAENYFALAGGNGGVGDGIAGRNGVNFPAYNPKMGQASTWQGINGKNGGYSPGYDGEGRGGGGGGFKGGQAIDIEGYKNFEDPNVTSPTADNGYKMLTGSGAGGSNHVKSTAKAKTLGVHNKFGPGYAIIKYIPGT